MKRRFPKSKFAPLSWSIFGVFLKKHEIYGYTRMVLTNLEKFKKVQNSRGGGISIKAACKQYGLAESSYYNMKKNEAVKKNYKLETNDSKYDNLEKKYFELNDKFEDLELKYEKLLKMVTKLI